MTNELYRALISTTEQIARETGAFWTDQFHNPAQVNGSNDHDRYRPQVPQHRPVPAILTATLGSRLKRSHRPSWVQCNYLKIDKELDNDNRKRQG
jgi:hypothetical protein